MKSTRARHRGPWVALAVVVGVTAALYARVGGNLFVYDDWQYLLHNRWARDGLTAASLRWASTSFYGSNWHPLTWLSHLLDVSLFRFDPRGHHLVNLALHLVDTVLLALVMNRLTGAVWRSIGVAALFALHPLHVESVAWVAERKDLLAALFFFLTLGAYVRYVRCPGLMRYGVVFLCLAAGLMAKPMLVTAPLVLLLLDWWPLGRLRSRDRGRMAVGEVTAPGRSSHTVIEKVPLLLLCLASAGITLLAQSRGRAMLALGHVGLLPRLENVVVSYAAYILKTILPSGLAVLYPYRPEGHPLPVAGTAAACLFLISLLVVRRGGARGYLAVGWLWYLITLLPVIGLVQVGMQARADRYTYLPLIGLFVMVLWTVGEWVAGVGARMALVVGAFLTALLALSVVTGRQVAFWKNDETLFRRALQVTEGNFVAHNNLGRALLDRGRPAEAADQCTQALRIKPDYADALCNLGLAHLGRGDRTAALSVYDELRRVSPRDAQDLLRFIDSR